MVLEWRPEYNLCYHIAIADENNSIPSVDISLETPFGSCSSYGIYNHLTTIVDGRTIKIVPRFFFGLPFKKVQKLYGPEVGGLPIRGVFTESTKYDRVIIQAYMNIVTLSVIFLLWANNPPESLMSSPSNK